MDEGELRRLAEELIAELGGGLISDQHESATVEDALNRSLATPTGSASPALAAALESHPAARAWLRTRLPEDSAKRFIGVAGETTTALGTYFVCPHQDFDFTRETLGSAVPLCPVHRVALVRSDG
jgi:hypothetical protein